jgi:hypothetical protein
MGRVAAFPGFVHTYGIGMTANDSDDFTGAPAVVGHAVVSG